MERLYINKTKASDKGVRMGEGFISTLRNPCPMKEYVANDSRLQHGRRVLARNVKIASRTITLNFSVHGRTPPEYSSNLEWLYSELYKGAVLIQCDDIGTEYYHLVYTGRSITYGEDATHCHGNVGVSFEEPNPTERGRTTTSIVVQ